MDKTAALLSMLFLLPSVVLRSPDEAGWPAAGDIAFITVDLMKPPAAGSECWSWVPRCDAVEVVFASPARRRWIVKRIEDEFELRGDWLPTFHRTEDDCQSPALKAVPPEVVREEIAQTIVEQEQPLPSGQEELQSTGCGEYLTPPFSGWVVYEPAHGVRLPLIDVQFYRGSGWIVSRGASGPTTPDVSKWLGVRKRCCPPSSMEPASISVAADGSFSRRVGISTSTTTWRTGTAERGETWDEDVVFELRAAGCDDLKVHFVPGWKKRVIVMSCPGRTTPPSD